MDMICFPTSTITHDDGTTEQSMDCEYTNDVLESATIKESVSIPMPTYTEVPATITDETSIEGTDPLEPHGEFRIQETDLSFPGFGSDFQFTRSYSNFRHFFGSMGPAWGHNFEQSLITVWDGTCGGSIEYVGAQGTIRFHHKPDITFGAPDIYEPDENGIGYRLEHVGTDYVLKDGSGLSYVFRETPYGLPWKPLAAIRDSLGHEQKIEWMPYDQKTWPQARVASVQDTTGRVIYFNYENRTYTDDAGSSQSGKFLKCLSLGKDDTCQIPLVSFQYNNLGELASVRDAENHGNTYIYDDGHAMEKALPTTVVATMCSSLCGSYAEDCHNKNVCNRSPRHLSSDPSSCFRSCQSVYPFQSCACAQLCYTNHNYPATFAHECVNHQNDLALLGGNAAVEKAILDAGSAAFFAEHPYCQGSSTSQECLDKCRDQYGTKDSGGNLRYSYGVSQDLNHNIIEVDDGEGRRVIKNQYGSDPSQISFDRVTDQWMGEKDSEENHVKLSYYDLTAEAVTVRNESQADPFAWNDLLCGSAYAAEGATLAMPQSRIRVPTAPEATPSSETEIPPTLTEANVVPDPSDALCGVLCEPNGAWQNVHLCYNLPCLVDAACVSSCLQKAGSQQGTVPTDEECYDACYDPNSQTKTNKSAIDACMLDFVTKNAQCEMTEHDGARGFSPFASAKECSERCKELYQTSDRSGTPFSPYGIRRDADSNVLAVYDDKGQKIGPSPMNAATVATNPATVETSRETVLRSAPVTTPKVPMVAKTLPVQTGSTLKNTQPSGTGKKPMVNAWAGILNKIGRPDFGAVLHAPERPLSPYVQSATAFKSVTICPQLGDSEENSGPWNVVGPSQNPQEPGPNGPYTPPPQMSLIPLSAQTSFSKLASKIAVFQPHATAQVPVLATVVEDLHGGKRTYYLDKRMRLLREVLFSAKGGGFQPYETTDYNYILKPGHIDRGVLYPSGEKSCTVSTAFDLPQSVTDYPAPNYEGEKSPRTSTLEYDPDGNQTKMTRKDGWSVEFVRDAQKRVKQIKTTVDTAKSPVVSTTNNYATDQDAIPSQVISADGSVTEQSDLDPWGAQPRSVILDKNGAAPVSAYTYYHPSGRVKEQGILGQRGSSWDYYANFLPKTMKVRKDPNAPWWSTSYEYNGANQAKTIETPDVIRQLRFDSLGNLVFTDDQPKDKVSQEKKHCFNYSPDGRLMAEMYPGGNVSEYTYDPAGRLVGEKIGFPPTSPAWANGCSGLNTSARSLSSSSNAKKGMEEVFSLTYKPGGFLEKVRENGVEYKIVTDGYGRVIDRIDPKGGHHRTGYSLFDDQVLWAADYDATAPPYGKPTFPDASLQAAGESAFDGLGRPTAAYQWHFADGKPVGKDLKLATAFSYDDANHTTTVTANGVSTTTKYDGLGRILSEVLPDNSKVTAQWDTNQNQVTWLEPGPQGNTVKTTQVFDGLGLVSKVIDDQGLVLLEQTRDALGRVLESKSAAGGARHYTYDSFGRILQTRQEAQPNADIILTYLWGSNDELLAMKDGNGNVTQSRYDGQGRLIADVDAGNRETRYDYYPDTDLVHQVLRPDGNNAVPDASSTQVTNEYDAAGSLRKQSIQHGSNVVNYGGQTTVREFSYTPLGLMATAKLTDANIGAVTNGLTDTFAYDSLGNVVSEKNSLIPLEIRHVTDPQSLKSSTTFGNAVIEHSFDALGRLGAVSLNGQPIAAFRYAGTEAPMEVDYGNGAIGSLTYDNQGLQTGVAVKNRNQNPLLSVRVAYGLDGSPRWKQSSLGSAAVRNDLFHVDGAGRLIAEGLDRAGQNPVGDVPLHPVNADVAAYLEKSPSVLKYTLDPSSNWTKVDKTLSGATTSQAFTPVATNAYAAVGGMSPAYDYAGDLTAFPSSNPTEKYSYNGLGQLLDATANGKTDAYYYDALGRRVAEMNARGDFAYYVWDGDKLLASGNNRLDEDNFTLNVTAGPDAPLAMVEHLGNGKKIYLHSGPDGSIMAASDDQSSLIEGYAYNAYGEPSFFDVDGQSEIPASKVGNRFLFQGMLYSPDSGLYLTPARAYKPAWGRWLTQDPIGTAGGSNLYAFVGGKPLTLSDSSGLCPEREGTNSRGGPTSTLSAATPRDMSRLRSGEGRLPVVSNSTYKTALAVGASLSGLFVNPAPQLTEGVRQFADQVYPPNTRTGLAREVDRVVQVTNGAMAVISLPKAVASLVSAAKNARKLLGSAPAGGLGGEHQRITQQMIQEMRNKGMVGDYVYRSTQPQYIVNGKAKLNPNSVARIANPYVPEVPNPMIKKLSMTPEQVRATRLPATMPYTMNSQQLLEPGLNVATSPGVSKVYPGNVLIRMRLSDIPNLRIYPDVGAAINNAYYITGTGDIPVEIVP